MSHGPPDALSWYYLDRSGLEYGPFHSQQICTWLAQNYFPLGDQLLVRLEGGRHHVPLRSFYPHGQLFVGTPLMPGEPPGAQWHVAPPHPHHHHPYQPPPHGHWAPPHQGHSLCPPPGHPPASHLWAHQRASPLPPLLEDSRGRSRSPRRRGGQRSSDGGGRDRKPFKPYHSISVPKRTDLSAAVPESSTKVTTAMLRNIPNKYVQSNLLEEIDRQGFQDKYDFFYLPMDMRNRTNVGYAFVNFILPEDMVRFTEHFDGYNFESFSSQKIGKVSSAHVQGIERNLRQLQTRAVTQNADQDYRPVIVHEGRRLDFEEALEIFDGREPEVS